MKSKIELLAPAGDIECFMSAVNAGANAIYFGLQEFNMRARSKNFTFNELKKIKKIADEKKIKLYLTLNTIIYDEEISKLEKLIKKVKPFVDAIICSDISVMLLCKKYKIPFHVSTQSSISNSSTAKFYKNLGAERIVLARELSLKQIKKISKIIPTEIFIHGAMCVSVSGRCFLSEHLYPKESANRGKCLQQCRRFYFVKDEQGKELKVSNHHIFSAKDLCTLPFLEKLKNSGAVAFKIEGRSREPEYVDTVVRIYKKALDKKLSKTEIENSIQELNTVYNKGFSSGFYFGAPTSDDFSDAQHSKATQKKEFIGKILHYYNNLGVGILKISSGNLKIGDDILIISKQDGIIRHKIESMQKEKKEIFEAKKGDEIGIKLPFCRRNNELYKIIRKEN